MKFDKDFKIAISNLPPKEKDKLILRLLKKNMTLANRLYFELVSTESVGELRAIQENLLFENIQHITNYSNSPGLLMMNMRDLSGEIANHVNITKDKYGDASLNLILLNETLKHNHSKIEDLGYGRSYKLCVYIIAKVFKILITINSLHEDYQIEFNDSLIELGNEISKNNTLLKIAIQNELDINWLLSADIPENIKEIHKEIRAQGFLR